MHRSTISFVLFILSLALSALITPEIRAQQVELRHAPHALKVPASDITPDRDRVVHLTPELMRSEEGRAALTELHRLKRLGLLNKRASQSSSAFTPGTQRTFRVQDFTNGGQFYDEGFTLTVSEPRFNLWIATSELATNGGNLVESDWQSFAETLGHSTSADSWNPDMGIIEIDETVFGPPSDIDGNGKVDILLHDIKDGYSPSNGLYTAGYFQPADLIASISGNGADIVHLDTYPGIYRANGTRGSSDEVLQTMAHEYQHLIFAFNKASADLAFIDEGLAEWAEVVTGFTPRAITYLNLENEVARPLLSWRESSSGAYGGPQSEDYQRGGLFHHYLAERLGTEIVGGIARLNRTGSLNYDKMLTDMGLDASIMRDLVQGFHVANLINDQTLNPAYGYESAVRSSVKALGFEAFDGSQATSSQTSGNLNSGSVRYIRWSQVGTFNIQITASSGANRLMPVLLLKPAFGPMERVFPQLGDIPTRVAGNFEEVYLVLPNVDLATSAPAAYTVSASWNAFSGGSQFQSEVFDTGEASIDNDGALLGFPIGGSTPPETEFANAFDVPEGGALHSVDVSFFFFSDLGGQNLNSNVKDFSLHVYDDNNGEPGSRILSKEVIWTSGISSPNLTFQTVDLSDHADVLSQHQGRIYVGIGNAGADDNYLFVPFTDWSASSSPSMMYSQFSSSGLNWEPFDNLSSSFGPLVNFVLPIRASINLIGGATDTESDDVLPQSLALHQNYPNPFNPNTTIRFSLPVSSDVRLEVYDLLGRNVATLVNGALPAGQHDVNFDASDLTSGLYLYTISTGTQRISRTMTLIK